MTDADVSGFCPYGCYWDCEHRAGAAARGAGRAPLHPVEDEHGHALMRCRDCGGYLYDVVAHAREHERLRQLGWLSERSRRA